MVTGIARYSDDFFATPKGRTVHMKEFRLGSVYNLELTASPSAVIGILLLWAVLSAVGNLLLGLTIAEAILGGLAATLLHTLGEFLHHLGHAIAARRTGYPMQGIGFGYLMLLAVSVYPFDEPELPAKTHIRRALGGPPANLLSALAAGAAAILLKPTGGLWYFVAIFAFLDYFMLFLGAFVPLGFTDGNTLLDHWEKR
jgi:hypothetical protein